MIVEVSYITTKTVEIEVDDKYKNIPYPKNRTAGLTWGQWSQLRRDLVKDVEKSPTLPEEAEKIYEISDVETNELLVRVDGNI